MRQALSVVTALVTLFFWSSAIAGVHTSTVRDVTTIKADTGEIRVLLNLGDLSSLTDVVVTSASLRIPLRGAALERQITLQVHPVTTAWDAGSVSWSAAGWRDPGGDFDPDVYSRSEVDLKNGGKDAVFNVSVALTEILEEERDVYGLIITVPPYKGQGIEADLETYLGAISGGELTVEYRKLYSIPPRFAADRGAHDGIQLGG